MSVGVVVGRFQTNQLTDGHLALLHHANMCDRLIIFVGVRPTPANATNPLPFQAIERMLRDKFLTATILPLEDNRSDVVWSKNLDHMIQIVAGTDSVTLYCGRDGFTRSYKGKYTVDIVDFNCNEINATEIREGIGKVIVNNPSWRSGVIYAYENMQHRTYHTVDMAGLRYNTRGYVEILLAQKPNESGWRFPGGFVEKGEKFTSAAAREFYEETDLYTQSGFKIVDDFIIDDWRVRGQKGVDHKTVLCVGWVSHGTPKAKDDISNVKWWELDYLSRHSDTIMVSEHKSDMIKSLVNYLLDRRIPLMPVLTTINLDK